MSRLVYTDTGIFFALINRRDQAHGRAGAHAQRLRTGGDRLLTCEPVIAETVTRLRYDVGPAPVATFRGYLDAAVAQGHLIVRESDADLRSAAFEVLNQYGDLRLSYADAVGAVVARQRRADAVFALDNDFRVMGFTVEP